MRTALVVDDLDAMLDLLEIALKAAEFHVLRASSVADALDWFYSRKEDIDLVLTDLRVGSENGLDLAQQLLTAKPTLRVLVMSGFASDRKLVKLRNDAIEFLPKPFTTSELKRKLKSVFSALTTF